VSVVLACDLGGTSFRAALIDRDGTTVAEHAVASPTGTDRPGWSEIDPADWWDVFVRCATAISGSAGDRFDAVAAIAICGVTRTQVFLGPDGRVLRDAITWRDTRAAATLDRLLPRLLDHPERAQVNAFHPLARLAWLRDAEADVFARLSTILEPKDYLNLRLTGVAASDPVSMARLHAARRPGADGRSLFEAAGLEGAVLPPLLDPIAPVGPVLPGLPGVLARLAGRPVFCASNDTWVAVAGLGAMRPRSAYNLSGTTEVFGVVGSAALPAEGLMTVDWGNGLHQIGGPGQNGADTVAWLLSLLGASAADFAAVGSAVEALLNGRRDSQPLIFLPYLQGERTPYWDADLRGAFVGLNRRHGAVDLAWAVLEGVAFLNRIVLERGEAAIGAPIGEIRFGGGAAANPAWCQAKADICERPVVVGTAKQPGLLGAAVLAWTGLGAFASLADAQEALVRIERRYQPVAARRPAYRELFAAYRQAEDALRPVSHRLAASGHGFASLPGIG
jgi:xylulokinase